ncbi:hypothetical protein RJT34_15435 [Clitoria ternatea]|uniref:Uncharacterized protein n=1 Tax=Clitoria ternatea TaxID=43366 RepID=A0AAN9J8B1_CLITE
MTREGLVKGEQEKEVEQESKDEQRKKIKETRESRRRKPKKARGTNKEGKRRSRKTKGVEAGFQSQTLFPSNKVTCKGVS